MIQICINGIYTEITINELYNIINIYSKSFQNNIDGHDKCLCKKYFITQETNETNNNIKQMGQYLLSHYEQLNNIGKIYDMFLNNYSKINWNIDHKISFVGVGFVSLIVPNSPSLLTAVVDIADDGNPSKSSSVGTSGLVVTLLFVVIVIFL